MKKCAEHNRHATERDALDALRWAKKQPGGHGLKHLNVYRCNDHWHIGRASRSYREATGPQMSLPKLRRVVENLGREIAAENRRIVAEENRRAQETARHTAELAAMAQQQADTLQWISEMLASAQSLTPR